MAWKLVSIEPSKRAGKKWMAFFEDKATGKHHTAHFGASAYEDFTQHGDPERAERYRNRHAKDLTTEAAQTGMTPGALSFYVLWTSPSMMQGIRNYKKRYSL